MKLCIISDIHSNIFFFEKCMEEIAKHDIDKIICLGDTIGYFDKPNEVIDILVRERVKCILGNHEAMMLGLIDYSPNIEPIYNLKNNHSVLREKYLNLIRSWVPFYELKINSRKMLFVHGSPYDPLNGYLYENTISAAYENLQYDFIFTGHTHRPYIRQNKNQTIVNVGSCGLPRDYGNMPSFVILNCGDFTCDLMRIKIDINDFINNIDVHEDVLNCLGR